jgi:hypothetical protein
MSTGEMILFRKENGLDTLDRSFDQVVFGSMFVEERIQSNYVNNSKDLHSMMVTSYRLMKTCLTCTYCYWKL